MKKPFHKKVIRYLHPGHTYLILAILLILFGIISISTIFMPILCVGIAALMIWLWSSSIKAFKKDVAAAEESGELDSIADDFSRSQPVLGKKIRLGESCVYGKNCGRIIRYKDIRRYDVQPNKKYMYPTCELTDGKQVSLCQLRASRSLDQYTKLLEIGNTIRSHNSNAVVE